MLGAGRCRCCQKEKLRTHAIAPWRISFIRSISSVPAAVKPQVDTSCLIAYAEDREAFHMSQYRIGFGVVGKF
jgi:hypothetical protein